MQRVRAMGDVGVTLFPASRRFSTLLRFLLALGLMALCLGLPSVAQALEDAESLLRRTK